MSHTVVFPVVVAAKNTVRSGAVSLVDQQRVRDAKSFFSSVVVKSVRVQVWLQKAFGRVYLVGPYPNTHPLPASASEVLAVPHARLLATHDQTDTIHEFELPVVPLEYDLAVVPVRYGHPDVWFGNGSSLGSGVQGNCIMIRLEVTLECSGVSFGLFQVPVTGFDIRLGAVDGNATFAARVAHLIEEAQDDDTEPDSASRRGN
jgi:hypothetical protein